MLTKKQKKQVLERAKEYAEEQVKRVNAMVDELNALGYRVTLKEKPDVEFITRR